MINLSGFNSPQLAAICFKGERSEGKNRVIPRQLAAGIAIFSLAVFIRACVFLTVSSSALACEAGKLGCLLDSIAASQQLEAVYGERFPEVNPYGSYGSPYVLDFATTTGDSILFLARKKNEIHKDRSSDTNLDLVRNYDYFLIFASRGEGDDSFDVKDVIEDVGLMGMSLFYGDVNIHPKEFSYINSTKKIVGSELDRRKLSTAVLISGESSTTILFYYGGSLIRYIERDW